MNSSDSRLNPIPRLGRRQFLQSILVLTVAARELDAIQAASSRLEVRAEGEIARRMELTRQRLIDGKTPSFSQEMVLADVALAPQRRFMEFSGDVSGRFIEAMSMAPLGSSADLDVLVERLLTYQRPDGRFGNAKLVFRADAIGPDHMALLWGNGRLLIGLMQYYRIKTKPRVLEAARRLGDFLISVEQECSTEAVRRRLRGQGANGFICFTQLVEGWVRLAAATNDNKYLDASRQVTSLLEERGIQHAHGYLATLRGFLELSEALKDPSILLQVEELYQSLINSPDYTAYSSVLEYFGWDNETYGEENLKVLKAASGPDPRDEGCGHADFLRLSLSLWRKTGKLEYLERAELCLQNGLMPNQFLTGDYGSRSTFPAGLKPTDNVDRAWWCCTMHGYRALSDLLESIVTENAGELRLNLYEDVEWKAEGWALSARAQGWDANGNGVCHLTVRPGDGNRTIALRQPRWAEPIVLHLNGTTLPAEPVDEYVRLNRNWKGNDRLEIHMRCLSKYQLRNGRMVTLEEFPSGVTEAILRVGPWLMGVDEADDPLFFGEPWPGNTLEIKSGFKQMQPPAANHGALPRLSFIYQHDGFFGPEKVTLSPIRDYGLRPPRILAVWLRFRKA